MSAPARAVDAGTHGGGGGPILPSAECISDTLRAQVESNVNKTQVRLGLVSDSFAPHPLDLRAPYPFVPIAGTEWQDRFVNNFVDLDPTTGILDWDCTGFSYDGHAGHDIVLRSFGEQDRGVPVYAALDGTVVDAHDGEFDKNTVATNQPANYVVLQHSGTHQTWYWHLRKNSVAVSVSQVVRAGTQLGLAASSGNSTGPHLHFESRFNGTFYEPSAGPCRPGQSYWLNQIPIRRDLWLQDFGMHNMTNIPSGSFLPYNPPRTGTFVRTGAFQPVGIWFIPGNLPASSTWRLRYLRPDLSLYFDSTPQSLNNSSFYRYSNWWLYYTINPNVAGNWTLEFSLNGQVMVNAPFTVLNSGGVPTNRPPGAVMAVFDPPSPVPTDVVFCRLTVPLTIDPDYDLMSYRFQWRTNGVVFRDVTNAAFSDAVQRNSAGAGDVLSCVVTPYDGSVFGPPTTVQALMPGGNPISLNVLAAAGNQVTVRWPTSQVNYVLESVTNFNNSWTAVTDAPAIVGTNNVVTNTPTGSRFFRLRWP